MPFDGDRESFLRAVEASPWPFFVKKHLRTPVGSFSSGEKIYTAAWAALLSHLFPGPEYIVCPASYRENGVHRVGADREVDLSAQLALGFQPAQEQTSGFMVHSFSNFVAICVELKDPMRFEKLSARLEADNQVRQRAWDLHTDWFDDTDPNQEWPSILKRFGKIYLISAFGYKAKVYELRTETFEVLPHAIVASKPRKVEDLAPIDDWKVDVLTDAGAKIMRAIAERTHQGALAAGLLTRHPGNRFDDYSTYLPNFSPTTGVSMRQEQAIATPTTQSPVSTAASFSPYDPANDPQDRRRETGYRTTPPATRSLTRSTGASTLDASRMNPFLTVRTDASPSYSDIQDPVTPDHNFNTPSSMAYYARGPSPNSLSPETALYRAGSQAQGQALLSPFQPRTRERRGNYGSDEDMDMEFSA